MRDPITLPRNPSEETKRINPSLYPPKAGILQRPVRREGQQSVHPHRAPNCEEKKKAKGQGKAKKAEAVAPQQRASSPFEEKFLSLFTATCALRGTEDQLHPEREYRFSPPRKWRFDFAWPHVRVFLELEGGTFSGGRHTRGSGFARDCDKYNSATLQGWVGFRIPTGGLSEALVEQIHGFIRTRTSQRPD